MRSPLGCHWLVRGANFPHESVLEFWILDLLRMFSVELILIQCSVTVESDHAVIFFILIADKLPCANARRRANNQAPYNSSLGTDIFLAGAILDFPIKR